MKVEKKSQIISSGQSSGLPCTLINPFSRLAAQPTHTTGAQTTALETTGIQTTLVQTTSLQTTGVQTTGIQTTGTQTTGVETTGIQTTSVQTTSIQSTGVTTTGIQTEQQESCNASNCQLPNCYCASILPPGGLQVRCQVDGPLTQHIIQENQLPQFVTITFDDAVTEALWPTFQSLFSNVTQIFDSAGCFPTPTFFVSNQWTNYYRIQQMKELYGIEIASHSVTHTTGVDTTIQVWMQEIEYSRTYTANLTQTPRTDIVGWRFPFF